MPTRPQTARCAQQDEHAPHRRAQRGFTILEMLIACAILGLGVVVLSGALADSVVTASQARDDASAVRLADALLARLGTDIPVQPGQFSGQSGDLAWVISIQPYGNGQEGNALPISLANVSLTLRWTTGRPSVAGTWATLRRMRDVGPAR